MNEWLGMVAVEMLIESGVPKSGLLDVGRMFDLCDCTWCYCYNDILPPCNRTIDNSAQR